MDYNFKEIETKWQSYWADKNMFHVEEDETKKKYYCLEMFPYPSGKLHMGHAMDNTMQSGITRNL